MARKLESDRILFGTVVSAVLLGSWMVFSASAVMAAQRYHSTYYFLSHQLIAAVIGLIAMLVAMNMKYGWLRSPSVVFSLVTATLVLLLVALVAGHGHNTHRWLGSGAFHFQPSELAKMALIIFLAYFLDRRQGQIQDARHTLLPVGAVVCITVLLVLKEPDLGTSLAIALVAAAMLFVAGLPVRYFVLAGLGMLPVLYELIFHVTYRLNRMLVFLHPGEDPLGKGFQMLQSLIAVGTGGLTGMGFMESRQKLFFLPEPHTDFIYAVICEEFGLIGGFAVLVLFIVILWRGLRAAAGCPDEFGRLLAIGITVMLVGQALVNASVVTGILPTKGLPLPFFSYGGSSLVINLFAAGILLNVSQHASGAPEY
jgi:cell division protein FtsW